MSKETSRSTYCKQCSGYTQPWCGHGDAEPPGPCAAFILVPLVTDEVEGDQPHAFPCVKRDGHDLAHIAHVGWEHPEE